MNHKRFRCLGMLCALLLACLVLPAQVQAGGIIVHTWEELKAALNTAHNHEGIVLANDITAEDVATLESGIRPPHDEVEAALAISGACSLNLGGHTLTLTLSPATTPECVGLTILPDGTLTLESGTLRINAEYALMNTGTLIVDKCTVEGYKAALMDMHDSYTEIRSGYFSGRKGAGYYNFGTTARIENGTFEGPMYGYFGGPYPKNVTIQNAQFHSFDHALYNVGSDPLADYLAPGAVITQNGTPADLDASPYAVQGDATIALAVQDAARSINLFIGDATIYITDEQLVHGVPMDVAPYINPETNRTMLPVRFVGEALGMAVTYDDTSRRVTLRDAQNTLILTLNSPEVFRNGGAFVIDTPPVVFNSRTMLPIGAIADLIGLSRTDANHPTGYIEWDGELQRIFISRSSG